MPSSCATTSLAAITFGPLAIRKVNLFALMGQLVERMRRALALRHLKYDKQFGWTVADFLARGRITWDDEQDGRVPLLVMDGQEIHWEQFGRMLMSFEGWQFKLEIYDRGKEI